MTDLKFTKEDASEAFYNIGKLAGRLKSDEGKRLIMLIQIIASYAEQLAEENKRLKDDDDFDMDGRC
jgi:adenylylsulfate kinase-like enzyme